MSKSVPQRNFFADNGSKFEPLLVRMLSEQLLPHVPASIHPNTLSLVTHTLVWITAVLALSSPKLSPLWQAVALLGAGTGTFLSMLSDCIEGLHAQRTDQSTSLGQSMDRWLGAIAVPLATAGITAALEMPPWAMVAVNLTAAMIFNARLVLYAHTGERMHSEPSGGIEGQFVLAVGYVALAGVFFYVDRHHPWVDLAVAALGCAATFLQLRWSVFYYPLLRGRVREHLVFVATCGGFGALYWLGAIGLHAFLFTVVFTSFRISGTYVLRSTVHERYQGLDLGLLAFVAAIFAVHYGVRPEPLPGTTLENLLAGASCLYAVARSLGDLSRHYSTLKPRAT
jgi:phosphatidylglycerophosphate synthase